MWKEYGALEFIECVADDVKPRKVTPFPQSVKLKKDEAVVFSWIIYQSRKHRDRVNAKVTADALIRGAMDRKNIPFDAMRMIWGAFKTMVEL